MEFHLGPATVTVDRIHDYYIAAPLRLLGAARPRMTRTGHVYSDATYEKFKKNLRFIGRVAKLPYKVIEYRGKRKETLDDGWLFLCNAYYKDDRAPDSDNAMKTILDTFWVQDKHVRGAVEITPKCKAGDWFEIWFWKLEEAK